MSYPCLSAWGFPILFEEHTATTNQHPLVAENGIQPYNTVTCLEQKEPSWSRHLKHQRNIQVKRWIKCISLLRCDLLPNQMHICFFHFLFISPDTSSIFIEIFGLKNESDVFLCLDVIYCQIPYASMVFSFLFSRYVIRIHFDPSIFCLKTDMGPRNSFWI